MKIERAKKLLRNLELELADFKGKRLSVLGGETDPNTGKLKGPYSSHDLPLLPFDAIASAGDIVHNLRAALDHLAYQLVLVGTPGREPSRRIEFPIARDDTTYKSEKNGKVQGMRPDAIEAIDRLKPYKGGNDALWRIHELDNIDKHRTLFTVGTDYLLTAPWMGNVPYWYKASSVHFGGVFGSRVNKELQMAVEEAARNPQTVPGNALLPALRDLIDFVDHLVASFTNLLE